MRRLLLMLALLFSFCMPMVLGGGSALAVNVAPVCNNDAAKDTDVCKDVDAQKGDNGNNNPIIDIIKGAINILSYIIGIAAIIGLIVGGIRMMTANGDSNSVASARSGIIYSLVGIAVVALAQALVAFVLNNVK